jgi:hypothetical protein
MRRVKKWPKRILFFGRLRSSPSLAIFNLVLACPVHTSCRPPKFPAHLGKHKLNFEYLPTFPCRLNIINIVIYWFSCLDKVLMSVKLWAKQVLNDPISWINTSCTWLLVWLNCKSDVFEFQ